MTTWADDPTLADVLGELERLVEGSWREIRDEARRGAGLRPGWTPEAAAAEMVDLIRREEGLE